MSGNSRRLTPLAQKMKRQEREGDQRAGRGKSPAPQESRRDRLRRIREGGR